MTALPSARIPSTPTREPDFPCGSTVYKAVSSRPSTAVLAPRVVSGQPLVGETRAEGPAPLVPVGLSWCYEARLRARRCCPGRLISVRKAMATAANLTLWPIQYPIPVGSTHLLNVLRPYANVRRADGTMLAGDSDSADRRSCCWPRRPRIRRLRR